jgi:flagellin
MRELAVQAASDTNGGSEKAMANMEFQGLKNEIYRVISVSRYSDRSAMSGTSELLQSQLVDRSPRSFEFRVGGGTSEGENSIKFRPQQLMMSKEDFNLTGSSIETTSGARSALSDLDQTIEKVSFSRASLGALNTQLGRAASVDDVTSENISAANSRIRDLDFASETAKNVKNKIISESNISIQSQANTNPQLLTKLLS